MASLLLLMLPLVSKLDVRPDISFTPLAAASSAVTHSIICGGPIHNFCRNLCTLLCNDLEDASSSENVAKIMALLTLQSR